MNKRFGFRLGNDILVGNIQHLSFFALLMNPTFKLLILTILFLGGILRYDTASAIATEQKDLQESSTTQSHEAQLNHDEHIEDQAHGESHGHAPGTWSVFPFLLLLIMIATGPLFYEHFWHKHYPKVAMALAGIVVVYYLFFLNNQHSPVHALFEYVQFIALLTGLFVASGGIMIIVDKEAKPLTNVSFWLLVP